MNAIEKVNAVRCWAASARVGRLLEPNRHVPFSTEHGADFREEWECPAIVGADLIPVLRSDLQALDRFLATGCPVETGEKCMAHLAALTKSRGDIPTAEAKIRVRAMANMLSEYPRAIVESACRQFALKSVFFPALAEIVDLIEPELKSLRDKRERLESMLRKAETDTTTRQVAVANEDPTARERRKLSGAATPEDLALLSRVGRQRQSRPTPDDAA